MKWWVGFMLFQSFN